MKKHAYLIIAHGNFKILKILLQLIDDIRNDIYIHIDKKVTNFDFESFQNLCHKSQIYFSRKRINVQWGRSSQVKTEMLLYKMAVKKEYSYYHLISGVDLPLKSQNEIHSFFENKSQEYIVVLDKVTKWDYQRLSRYRFPPKWNNRVVGWLNYLQEKLHIDRIKKFNMTFCRGYNWCSLTHNAVSYLVEHEKLIKKNLQSISMCR